MSVSLILVSSAVALFVFLVQQYYKSKAKLKWVEKVPGVAADSFIENVCNFIKLIKSPKVENAEPHPDIYILQQMLGQSVLYRKWGFYRFWIGQLPIVSLYSPEAVEKVLSSNVSLEKSFDYDFAHDWLGHGLLTSVGAKWKSRRRMLTPCFHFRILDDFLPVFNEQCNVMVKKIASLADKESIDMLPLILLCTLDIVCETMMGCPVGAQIGENTEYVTALHNFAEALIKRSYSPLLWPNFIFHLTSMGRNYRKDLNTLHSFTREIIKKKKNQLLEERSKRKASEVTDEIGTKKKKALMDLLLGLQLDGEDLSDDDIRQEIDTFMFAGHDTTAIGITFALYCIGLYPDIQDKIYEEIESIFGDDKERPVTMEDVRNLKYLECVLKEGQRIYPSVPYIGRLLNEDININGTVIPKGATVNILTMSMHNDPKLYPDPEKFDPDRFLPENSTNRHPYSYVPFSAGSRNCIGQKFAMLEEKVIVCNVLRHFKVYSLDPRDKMQVKVEFTLRPAVPVRLKFTPR